MGRWRARLLFGFVLCVWPYQPAPCSPLKGSLGRCEGSEGGWRRGGGAAGSGLEPLSGPGCCLMHLLELRKSCVFQAPSRACMVYNFENTQGCPLTSTHATARQDRWSVVEAKHSYHSQHFRHRTCRQPTTWPVSQLCKVSLIKVVPTAHRHNPQQHPAAPPPQELPPRPPPEPPIVPRAPASTFPARGVS